MKKKIIIGFSTFLTIAAIVGLALGLYFHFSPSSNHIHTTVASTSDGTVYSSTKFLYTDNNLFEDNANYTFTIMHASLNSTDTQRRMLQTEA